MISDEPGGSLRPATVTVAFWCQLAVAGLLGVLTLVNAAEAVLFTQLFGGAVLRVFAFLPAILCVLAVWLAVTAFGLRRAGRTAYRLSLAGMALPVLAVAVASVSGGDTTTVSIGAFSTGDDTALERLTAWSMVMSMVNGPLAVAALALAVATVTMLLTATSRRFFGSPARPGGAPD
ncbi:hypothetical protein [Actinoplanes sp. DH11]|uniref:hypothetical protein n=1 Tax=Actinoplanes sp. DH11 TaxID=2857011 RepID=UPI001E301135|nr:hypothetical protein [Actinoplanes sp. DH11]